jgi:hypothetical protein
MALLPLLTLSSSDQGETGAEGPRPALEELKAVLHSNGFSAPTFLKAPTSSGSVIVLAPMDGTMAALRQSHPLAQSQRIARMITFSPQQHLYALESLKLKEDQVDMIPPPVDHAWFQPIHEPAAATSGKVLVHGFASSVALPGLPRNRTATLRTGSAEERRTDYGQGRMLILGAPSRSASGGLNILMEAMACGMAVIAPRTFSMEFLLSDGENSLTYDPSEAGSLERAIREMEADLDLRKSLGSAARHFICDHGTLSHFAARAALVASRVSSGDTSPLYFVIPGRIALAP